MWHSTKRVQQYPKETFNVRVVIRQENERYILGSLEADRGLERHTSNQFLPRLSSMTVVLPLVGQSSKPL